MRARVVFAVFALVLAAVLSVAARAEDPTPYSGTRVIEAGKPFEAYIEALKAAIADNGMGVVAEACATCGAKAIGVTIPGNRVVMIFHPRYAVRMLAASEAAGIEAPLRLYVTERANGQARLTYRLPSAVFGAYQVAALDALGKELDGIVAKIVADAGK